MKIRNILNSVFVWGIIVIAITSLFYSYISNAITSNVVGAAMAISYTAVAIYIIRKGDDIMMMIKKAWEWLCNDHNPVFKLFISVVYISAFGGWMVTTMNRVVGSEHATIQDLVLLVMGTVVTLGAMARVAASLIDMATQPAHKPHHPLPWMKHGSWGWWMIVVLVTVGCGDREPIQGWTEHPNDRTYVHRVQVAKWEVGKLTSLEQIFPSHAAYDVERAMGGCNVITGDHVAKHHYNPALYPAPCAREIDGVYKVDKTSCRACTILHNFHHPKGWTQGWTVQESTVFPLFPVLFSIAILTLKRRFKFTSLGYSLTRPEGFPHGGEEQVLEVNIQGDPEEKYHGWLVKAVGFKHQKDLPAEWVHVDICAMPNQEVMAKQAEMFNSWSNPGEGDASHYTRCCVTLDEAITTTGCMLSTWSWGECNTIMDGLKHIGDVREAAKGPAFLPDERVQQA
ncbi:MAG: hypothetical protein QF704_08670, partial [Anaerolineales bacterium]|nr:hypothetical protein [Anaerolineales bacterium]